MHPLQDPQLAELLATRSLTELLAMPDDVPITLADVPAIREILWSKYLDEARHDARRQQEDAVFEYAYDTPDGPRSAPVRALTFHGRTLHVTTEARSEAPATGYPLVLALHGGGATDPTENNADWTNVQSLWSQDVDPGLYAALRGVTDTWDLHFTAESYALVDRFIDHMVVFHGADPDRVYLVGFSAGGDGTYQLAARMPDRFAACSMMAGHPNGITVRNYRNLGFLIQMGQEDTAYDRAALAAEWDAKFAEAAREDPDGYRHETFLHPGGDHNSWLSATLAATPQPTRVLARPSDHADANAETVERDTALYPWLYNFVRTPRPDRVVVDAEALAESRQGLAESGERLWPSLNRAFQFYWLDLGANRDVYGPVAARRPGPRSLVIESFGAHLRVFLHERETDLEGPLEIIVEGDSTQLVQPRLGLKTMVRTLVDRGDREYIFPAELYLERADAGTEVLVPTPRELGAVEQAGETVNGDTVPRTGGDGVCFLVTAHITRPILRVIVALDLDHTHVGHLTIVLVSPQGTAVPLADRRGRSGNGFKSTVFDDDAPHVIAEGAPPFNGAFRPDGALSAFAGECPAGTWSLRVYGESERRPVTLHSWQLELVTM